MDDQIKKQLLGNILKDVSRSFYLSLRVLPRSVREPTGIAYLLARAADTIADAQLCEAGKSLEKLNLFLVLLSKDSSKCDVEKIITGITVKSCTEGELKLLRNLGEVIDFYHSHDRKNRQHIEKVVSTLISGMVFDLETFPNHTIEEIVVLPALDDLNNYTYKVAGCVGEFWTDIIRDNTSALNARDRNAMVNLGIEFGKALQLTNIARDVSQDLRIGRCYFPRTLLDGHGLKVRDLLLVGNSRRAKPVLCDVIRLAVAKYKHGERYLLSIPRNQIRIRLSALWPLMIGLGTLEKLANNHSWLDPATVTKVKRAQVYVMMLTSVLLVNSNTLLKYWIHRQIKKVEMKLTFTVRGG